ncbi:MAG: PSD1 and planctomycete cytochrome C domain-containing protein [Pirellulales bacterium]
MNFNRDIRPILAENCFYCHGQDGNKREAGLRLDIRDDAVAFGAIDLAKPADSPVIKRILDTDSDTMMPPPKSNRHLTEAQKQILQQWVQEGAEYSAHWAFVKPERPTLPTVQNSAWVRNPIDQFVLAKLDQEGLKPSPEADRTTLIKRLYADLIGLPPTPEQVDRFLNDKDPNAYENLVDSLLKDPHYGERVSLPWLDAARYADSNGFQQDGDTWQWMWRDWVVKALNENLPFDQFTIWQLAGDLLPDSTVEQKIASGFNRNHLLNGEGGAIAEEQRFVILFDRMDTTATTFLGLSMACGQCHDHKYDPLTQRDYYSLMDAFNRVPETGTPQFFTKRIRVGNPVIEVPSEDVIQRRQEFDTKVAELEKTVAPLLDAAFHGWRVGIFADKKPEDGKGLPEALVILLKKEEKDRTDEDKKSIEKELRKHFDQKVRDGLNDKLPAVAQLSTLKKERTEYLNENMPRPMIMSDAQPRQTHILTRGEYLKPGEKVEFATPGFLPPMNADWPKNRLGLAYWLVSSEQPLTSRVQVNRMWQYFFGSGLVKTSEDFGVQSEYPIHLDMLNWLAVDFRENGWDMKRLNRMIVTSSTYRQSSKVSADLRTKDPENKLYGRAPRNRMPSMILRDWALASSGAMDDRIGGKPVYPYQPDAIWESLAITKERDFTYPGSTGKDLYRRSLYTFWRRTVGPANMFDASSRQTCKVRVALTSTPLHALTTMNDPTWIEASRILAEKAMLSAPETTDQLQFAFRRVLCRKPTNDEIEKLSKMWGKQFKIFSEDIKAAEDFLKVGAAPRNQTLDVAGQAAMSAVCLALYNLDEALTRE